ncbi:MAG: hypothetical protein J6J23_04415 [Clostridia bacterium]|nr:hypothetical protein [Clostridia bacterium]
MNCLGFDCSGKDVVAGVWKGMVDYYEVCLSGKSGTEYLTQAIDMCLKKAKLKIDDIDVIGVCVGPGSWTGSRVAVSTMNGLISGMKNEPKVVSFDVFDLISYNEIDSIFGFYMVVPAYGEYVYVKEHNNIVNFGPYFMSKEECFDMIKVYDNYGLEQVYDDTIVVERKMAEVLSAKVENGEFTYQWDIEPMYLRPSQAELQFDLKNKRKS